MKKNRIIIPALGLIALGTAASITGTVAWFTANNSVKITGMVVKTQVGSNLLIANDQTTATFNDTAFASELSQTREAKLEPVSSIDAVNFYYTTVSNDNGTAKESSPFYQYSEAPVVSPSNALADTNAGKTNFDTGFNNRYGVTTPTAGLAGTVLYGYVDYTFYLKATFANASEKIVMDKCNMYTQVDEVKSVLGGTDLSWRVGVLAHVAEAETEDGVTTVTTYTTAMGDGDRKTILNPTGADYFTKTGGTSSTVADAVNGLGAARGDGNAPTYADVKNLGDRAVIYQTTTPTPESNKVIKVTVRLWLEGEDNNCYVDNYKALTSNHKLDLSFKIVASDDSTTAVNVIGSSIA